MTRRQNNYTKQAPETGKPYFLVKDNGKAEGIISSILLLRA